MAEGLTERLEQLEKVGTARRRDHHHACARSVIRQAKVVGLEAKLGGREGIAAEWRGTAPGAEGSAVQVDGILKELNRLDIQ